MGHAEGGGGRGGGEGGGCSSSGSIHGVVVASWGVFEKLKLKTCIRAHTTTVFFQLHYVTLDRPTAVVDVMFLSPASR